MKAFRVFTRNWWKINPEWPGGLEPDGYGSPRTIGYARTEEEARRMCREWNDRNPEGRLSRRAEYTSQR